METTHSVDGAVEGRMVCTAVWLVLLIIRPYRHWHSLNSKPTEQKKHHNIVS